MSRALRQSPRCPGPGQAAGAPPAGAPTADCTTHVNAMPMRTGWRSPSPERSAAASDRRSPFPGLGLSPQQRNDVVRPAGGPQDFPGSRGRRALHAAAPAVLHPQRQTVGHRGIARRDGGSFRRSPMAVARLVDREAGMQEAAGGRGFPRGRGSRSPWMRGLLTVEKRGAGPRRARITGCSCGGKVGADRTLSAVASGIRIRDQGPKGISFRAGGGSGPYRRSGVAVEAVRDS